MAYASLVSLENTTDLILNDDNFSISVDGREQITSIRVYVNFLISFFENFPEKANRIEGKIRDLANEAEDLIEYFMLRLSGVEFEGQLKRVREEIGTITGDLMDNRLCHVPAAISSSGNAASDKNDVVVGLDEDLIAIKDRLCGTSSKLEVIPIVGMGGIGKTTLAQNAYSDSLIMGYFDIRSFVQVSQDYSAKELLSKILDSIDLFKKQMNGEENESGVAESECNEFEIAVNVFKGLKGRRYLIVMDDIWSINVWDDVRNVFPDDDEGSRIILTTRDSNVAAYAGCGSPLHEMKFMDGNHSWNLLKQKVFENGQDCPPELEDMGKAIARSCRGLPLAVVLVAGILSTNDKTEASWEKIAKNVNSVVNGQLGKILSLSYTLLPHHLRACFLFMAGYPEDHKIQISKLIKLWIAEGFLKRQSGHKSLEEKAYEYLEDLVKRNLVLITSWKSDGKIKSCSLHDLVRDMCITKAQEEKFLPTVRAEGRHRISIGDSSLNNIWGPTIRTILCFQTTPTLDSSSLAYLVIFRLLRVLDIKLHKSSLIPPQLFELFHLRFLALGCPIKIPAAISKLENLQTLIIYSSRLIFYYALPLEIWRMSRLRNLVLPCKLLDPRGPTRPLENLHTLSNVASFICSKKILKMIPNIKKLGILYSRDKEHQLQNLVNLRQLEKLKITVSGGFSPWRQRQYPDFPLSPKKLKITASGKFSPWPWQRQYPAFPLSLKKLSLVGELLPWKDMSIVGSLPNLQVLKLKNHACFGETWETTDGEFPQLKFLLIDRSNLQDWITESNHFPRLKCLALHRCPNLRQIPDSIGEISTLELIKVDTRNESVVKSAKQIQEAQRSYGNDALQVHCENIPSRW